MVAAGKSKTYLSELLADLTDAAYRAALARGLRGAFVDAELGVWKALCRTLAEAGRQGRLFAGAAGWGAWQERLVGELTAAAYEALQAEGVTGPAVDLELALWHALGDGLRRSQFYRQLAGLFAPADGVAPDLTVPAPP